MNNLSEEEMMDPLNRFCGGFVGHLLNQAGDTHCECGKFTLDDLSTSWMYMESIEFKERHYDPYSSSGS